MNELAAKIHETAKEKGWWKDGDRNFGEIIALIHSELSEALEEYRSGHSENEVYHKLFDKPEGVPIELADAIIRILDFCCHAEIDIDQAIAQKMKYNESRPFRHGGKKA